jgi:hypothetical protein
MKNVSKFTTIQFYQRGRVEVNGTQLQYGKRIYAYTVYVYIIHGQLTLCLLCSRVILVFTTSLTLYLRHTSPTTLTLYY